MAEGFELPCIIANTDVDFKLIVRPDTVLRYNNENISVERAFQLLSVSGQPRFLRHRALDRR